MSHTGPAGFVPSSTGGPPASTRVTKIGISLPTELVDAIDSELALAPMTKSAFIAEAVRAHLAARQDARLAAAAALLDGADEDDIAFEVLRP